MMAGLLGAFAIQTALVYLDPTADRLPLLDELALRGRQVWLDYNCQSCHQVHGFGGFLGPDLTNVASRINRERLDEVLTVGSGQMPAWKLNKEQIDAVEAYLRVLNGTGIGQARRSVPFAFERVSAAIDQRAAEHPMTAAASRGQEHFRTTCSACHRLFTSTPLGAFLAADLTDVRKRLSDAELNEVLIKGRPMRGMPAWGLSEVQRANIVAYLDWLGEHREVLLQQLSSDAQTRDEGLPWFEFR